MQMDDEVTHLPSFNVELSLHAKRHCSTRQRVVRISSHPVPVEASIAYVAHWRLELRDTVLSVRLVRLISFAAFPWCT